MTLSDQEYVQRCRNGSPDDFRHLVARYEGPVFAFVSGRVRDSTLAKEATEEALVRAFFALPQLKRPASFHAWLLGIASRVAQELQRSRDRRREVPPSEPEPADTPPPAVEENDDALHEAIAALPPLQREVILMRYFQKLSCQEIADRRRMPLGSVTKTLSRAYAGLRELIAARESNPPQLERTS